MIGETYYRYATQQLTRVEAKGAWAFLLGYWGAHMRTCALRKCLTCDGVKAAVEHIEGLRQQRELSRLLSGLKEDQG